MNYAHVAQALRLAADIGESDLNPEYAIPAAIDIATAVAKNDLTLLADPAGIHDSTDDGSTGRQLTAWAKQLHDLATPAQVES